MAAAYVVARHGAVYAPLFERLESELAELRAKGDPVSRACRYLEINALPAGKRPVSISSPAA
ncbi:hypothetical protein [Mesorhizobium sp. RMAD-H1]|uniref:hypothetical protein n=1 Tax=Mesorhizobium sp. RMAD-H1 TaxID=2587065 RepID=UPI00161DBA35|nr:hypothetical protein [Mesorhizobium sp. RMAD-H1]MBB2973985.1 hypothetical protein [Mesorhizobium sp. RMAD-H1]